MEGYTNFTKVYASEGIAGNVTGNVTGNASGTVEARTATVAGATTGTISANTTYVSATSANANHIIILPAPVVGKVLVIDVGATGFKLKPNAATVGINGGTPGAAAVSVIAANSTCYLICVSATAWKGFFMDADGDVAKIAASA